MNNAEMIHTKSYFCYIKPEAVEMYLATRPDLDIDINRLYTYSTKGWPFNSENKDDDGKERVYINELEEWIPTENIETVVKFLNPN